MWHIDHPARQMIGRQVRLVTNLALGFQVIKYREGAKPRRVREGTNGANTRETQKGQDAQAGKWITPKQSERCISTDSQRCGTEEKADNHPQRRVAQSLLRCTIPVAGPLGDSQLKKVCVVTA